MKIKPYLPFLFVLIFFVSIAIAFAEELDESITVNGDMVEYMTDEKKIVAEGNVSVEYGDVLLTCDKVTIFPETKDAYCEGNVTVVRHEGSIEGDKIHYNFNEKKGVITDFSFALAPWYGRGTKAELCADGSYHIKDGYVTTCDREHPHYRVAAKDLTITPNEEISASGASAYIGKMKLVSLPRYTHSFSTHAPKITVVPGQKKKWGPFVLTSYRYKLSEHLTGNVRWDYRYELGMGEGVDLSYGTERFGKGLAKLYFTHEDDDRRGEVLSHERDRYRAQLRHRWQIDPDTTGIVEFHTQKDPDFIKDYFYNEEYKWDHQPESYVSVVRQTEDYGLGLFARAQVDEFFDATEKLPEVKFNWKTHQIGGLPLYVNGETSAANLTNKTALSDVDDDVARGDVYGKLTGVHKIGPVNISPYVSFRETWYSKELSGEDNVFRGVVGTGIGASTKFFRTYDVASNAWGMNINKIRHIITPAIKYSYLHKPTVPSNRLVEFDDLDAITGENKITFEVTNRFQTKRQSGESLAATDLAMVRLLADCTTGPAEGNRWSNVELDVELMPSEKITIESDVKYDPQIEDVTTWNLDLITRQDTWEAGIGSRYERETQHELVAQTAFNVGEKWRFRIHERFDFKEVINNKKRVNHLKAQEYSFTRDLHCWLMDLTYSHDSEGGDSFWVAFRLKAFPGMPFGAPSAYFEPMDKE